MAHGRFSGEPDARWLSDKHGADRTMKLLTAFWFRDPKKKQWDAPAGSVVDGASIPRALWSIVGSPYTGCYRRGSIVHDVSRGETDSSEEIEARVDLALKSVVGFSSPFGKEGVTEGRCLTSRCCSCARQPPAANELAMREILASSQRDLTIVGVFIAWFSSVLMLDVGAGIWSQRALGIFSWLVLFALLRGEGKAERFQVAVVVMFATAVEYTAAPLLGFYTYRLHNVPMFVPPGHGGLFLAALALGRSDLFRRYGRVLVRLALVAGGAWAMWGVTFAARQDVLGLLLFGGFLCVVANSRAPSVLASTFVLTAALELFGTSLGTWRWATHDPTGMFTIGNPPSGIAGGYSVFDMVALTGGSALAALVQRISRAAEFSPPWARYRPLPP